MLRSGGVAIILQGELRAFWRGKRKSSADRSHAAHGLDGAFRRRNRIFWDRSRGDSRWTAKTDRLQHSGNPGKYNYLSKALESLMTHRCFSSCFLKGNLNLHTISLSHKNVSVKKFLSFTGKNNAKSWKSEHYKAFFFGKNQK